MPLKDVKESCEQCLSKFKVFWERNSPFFVGALFLLLFIGFISGYRWFGVVVQYLIRNASSNPSPDYTYALHWFVASQFINSIGCMVAAFYLWQSAVMRWALWIMSLTQIGILFFPQIYNGNLPVIACLVEYGLFIVADFVGWKWPNSRLTPKETTYVITSCKFSMAFTDFPAFAVTFLFLCCSLSQGQECVNFSFVTGASGAITVLNNVSYSAVQAILRRGQPVGVMVPASTP